MLILKFLGHYVLHKIKESRTSLNQGGESVFFWDIRLDKRAGKSLISKPKNFLCLEMLYFMKIFFPMRWPSNQPSPTLLILPVYFHLMTRHLMSPPLTPAQYGSPLFVTGGVSGLGPSVISLSPRLVQHSAPSLIQLPRILSPIQSNLSSVLFSSPLQETQTLPDLQRHWPTVKPRPSPCHIPTGLPHLYDERVGPV